MSAITQLDVGGTYYREVDIIQPSGSNIGLKIDADLLPTVEIRNGNTIVTDAIGFVITHIGTGEYSVTFTVPPTWALGSSISVFLNVVLSAYTGSPFRSSIDIFTVIVSQVSGVGGTPLVNRTALENTWGASNIATWADADNDQNATTISNRIAWALTMGQSYVLGRLANRYALPFAVMPTLVVQLICDYAGVYLYRSPRGVVEGDVQSNQVNSVFKNAEDQLGQIMAGRLKLVDGVKTEPTNYIRSINDPIHLSIGGPDGFGNLAQVDGNFLPLLPDSLWYQTD